MIAVLGEALSGMCKGDAGLESGCLLLARRVMVGEQKGFAVRVLFVVYGRDVQVNHNPVGPSKCSPTPFLNNDLLLHTRRYLLTYCLPHAVSNLVALLLNI